MAATEMSQSEKAYKILKRRILDQELKSGYPVVEVELAKSLEMSRTPVREALRRLEADGLLEVIPRKGTYIRSFSIADLIKVYEVAAGLEGMVAYLVAEKQSQDGLPEQSLQDVESRIAEMDRYEKEKDFRSWAETDEEFHRILYVLCDNQLLSDIAKKTRTQLNTTLFKALPSHVEIKESNDEHRRILKAIQSGDKEAARSVIQKQHYRVRENLIRQGRLLLS